MFLDDLYTIVFKRNKLKSFQKMKLNEKDDQHNVKILDHRYLTRTTIQKTANIFCVLFNAICVICYLIIVIYYYQTSPLEYTYFRGGTTNCDLYYSFGMARFLFFFVGLYLWDLRVSVGIGTPFLKVPTLVVNGIYCILLIVTSIETLTYLKGCGVNGYGDASNICQGIYFCGIANNTINTDNNCQIFNPYLLPTCTLSNLNNVTNPNFFLFLVALGTLTISHIFKTIASLFLKETIQPFVTLFKTSKNFEKSIKNQSLPDIYKSKSEYVLGDDDEIGYLDLDKSECAILYINVEIFDAVYGIFFAVYLGWFQPNVQSLKSVYTLDPSGTCTNVINNQYIFNFILYLLIGLLVIPWVYNAYLADLSWNYIVKYFSIFGLLLNILLFIFFLVAIIGCNGEGNGTNPCTSKLFCAVKYLVSYAFEDPRNNCTNNYACPFSLFPNQVTWSTEFTLAFVVNIVSTISNFINLIDAWYIQIKLSTYVASPMENKLKFYEVSENKIEKRIIEQNIKDTENLIEKKK